VFHDTLGRFVIIRYNSGMSYARRVFCTFFLLGLPFTTLLAPVRAQDLGEASEVVTASRDIRPKQVILIFDTSGSMKSKELVGGGEEMMRRARTTALTILREAVRSGDKVVVQTFGAGTKTLFDGVYQGGERQKLIDAVPSKPDEGAGTNIRRPHHDALRRAEAYTAGKTFIVLLTDSFNDQPNNGTNEWNDYVKYYVPGQLLKYPNTTENADYTRLLAAYPGISYGVGVKIDPATGRPVERDPREKIIAEATPEPTVMATPAPVKPPESYPFLPYLFLLLPVLAGGVVAFLMFKPVPLRISSGAMGSSSGNNSGQKDFQVKASTPVRLGGEGANFSSDSYPIPGVKEMVATVTGSRGSFSLQPAPQLPAGLRVYHNGVPLQGATPLRYGDELRVSVPDANGTMREIRLKFSDPSKSF
jgi:hypothetical protein